MAGRVLVKICGLTRREDVAAAVAAGADLVGFVFAASPRRVTPGKVLEIGAGVPAAVKKVGVFVDERPERVVEIARTCGLDLVQLHGGEDEAYCRRILAAGCDFIKVFRLGRDRRPPTAAFPGSWALLFDTFLPGMAGGGGRTFDWNLVSGWSGRRFFLAGGLDPGNVGRALALTRPFGVDVSSGVESAPGIKDHEKIKRFVTAVHDCRRGSGVAAR